MFPQLDRWQRKTHRKAGWTLPGVKRHEYVDSLNPHPKLKKEPKMTGYTLDEDTAGRRNYQSYQISNAGYITGSTAFSLTPTLTASTTITLTGNNNLWWPTVYATDNVGGIYRDWTRQVYLGMQIPNAYLGSGATTGITVNSNWVYDPNNQGCKQWSNPALTPEQEAAAQAAWQRQLKHDQLKQKLAAPLILTKQGRRARANNLIEFEKEGPAEINALGLLKSMLPIDEWHRYLTHGFIVVRGSTGLRYQIGRGQSHIKVYRQGVKIAELCLMVSSNCPPTDHVIAKKIMVECDELGVWGRANIHNHARWPAQYQPNETELQQLTA